MDRRALQYFLAVADHGTFTNAAAALHVAQPSLSQAVQGLERELGVKLFYRVKRGARLTAAGEALVGPARRTLRDFDEARDAVLNVSGLRSGRVDIVTQPHLAADPLPQLLAPFHERYPEVAIRITDPGSSDIPGTLHAGEAEIGLDMSPPIDPGLSVMRLPDEEVLILLPPGSPDLGPVVPVSALGNINLVAGATVEHAPVVRIVREAGMTSRILVETTHRIATVPLVLAGLGAALLTAPGWPSVPVPSPATSTRRCIAAPSSCTSRRSTLPPPERSWTLSASSCPRSHHYPLEPDSSPDQCRHRVCGRRCETRS